MAKGVTFSTLQRDRYGLACTMCASHRYDETRCKLHVRSGPFEPLFPHILNRSSMLRKGSPIFIEFQGARTYGGYIQANVSSAHQDAA